MEPWLLLLLALLYPVLFSLFGLSKKLANLPPGPRPWPAVGNLPHLIIRQIASGQRLHAALAALAARHGPLVYLRLGSTDFVVASSPAAAEQVLKTNDRTLSARHVPATYRVPDYADHSMIWRARCDDSWRSHRALIRADLLSPRSLAKSATARKAKAGDMARFFQTRAGQEVAIGKAMFTTVINVVGDMLFSKDLLSLEEGRDLFPELKQIITRTLELAVVPSVEDFFPGMTAGLDLQRLRRRVEIYTKKIYGFWDEIMRQRSEDGEDDFLKVLKDNGIKDNQLKALLSDLITAGSDSSVALAEWLMAELLRSPEKMKRVRDELSEVTGHSPAADDGITIPDEAHLSRLDYLHACVKEALRLHPPVPLLLPRRATDCCEIMGYAIPKDCTVVVNAWAIGRDPEIWENPLSFSPERFLGCSVDYKGADFQFLPFGGGMRTCPGISMAVRMVQLLVATMVHNFDWLLPGGQQLGELDMEEKIGLVLERKHPLVLIPNPRVIG